MSSWNDFCNSVKKTVGQAADKINQTADLATLQVKLSVAKHKLDEAYATLGRAAYRHFSAEEAAIDPISDAMGVVETAQKAVQELEAQISALKKQENASADA